MRHNREPACHQIANVVGAQRPEKITDCLELHDFLPVQSLTGEVKVALNSNRKKAFGFSLPDLSLIHAYMKKGGLAHGGGDPFYSFTLDASAPSNTEESTQKLSSAYLVTLNLDSITKVATVQPNLRKTTATYSRVWEDGESESVFNASVSSYSGPRNTVYIDSEDPWWDTFIDGSATLSATYTDLDIDGFDQELYPRRINVDMLLVPSSEIEYTPLQGRSTIKEYENEGVVRTLKIAIAPTIKGQRLSYIKPIPKEDGESFSGDTDLYAIQFEKGYSDDDLKSRARGTVDARLYSSKSLFGRVIGTIDSIKDNYNLQIDGSTSGIPHLDVFSFFTAAEVIEFIHSTPTEIRENLFFGYINV